MAKITFSLDTVTNQASASIDGKEITNLSCFSYYKHERGFDLSIQEKELELSDGLEVYTSHRACGSEIVSTSSKDDKKALSSFMSNVLKRNQ